MAREALSCSLSTPIREFSNGTAIQKRRTIAAGQLRHRRNLRWHRNRPDYNLRKYLEDRLWLEAKICRLETLAKRLADSMMMKAVSFSWACHEASVPECIDVGEAVVDYQAVGSTSEADTQEYAGMTCLFPPSDFADILFDRQLEELLLSVPSEPNQTSDDSNQHDSPSFASSGQDSQHVYYWAAESPDCWIQPDSHHHWDDDLWESQESLTADDSLSSLFDVWAYMDRDLFEHR